MQKTMQMYVYKCVSPEIRGKNLKKKILDLT